VAELSEGLDLSNLDETSEEEIRTNLMHVWSWRGPLYEMQANSLMLDYAPDFAKLHRWASDLFGRPDPEQIILLGIQNFHSYMMYGWETGIRNQFISNRRNGLEREEIMELVMFSQLCAGMRGLGHVYRAIGDFLPSIGPAPKRPAFPEGWAPDPEAFKCGLDLTQRKMTDQEKRNLREWYESTIGFVPKSVVFALRHDPDYLKVNRAKWEVAIKRLPKQVAPYLMLRHHMITGSVQGLREAALLCRSWGVAPRHIVLGISASSMYFTGLEGLYAAYDAVEDLLEK